MCSSKAEIQEQRAPECFLKQPQRPVFALGLYMESTPSLMPTLKAFTLVEKIILGPGSLLRYEVKCVTLDVSGSEFQSWLLCWVTLSVLLDCLCFLTGKQRSY